MIVLDTNIVSELQRPSPAGSVLNWISSISIEDTFICDPVLMELAYGAERHFLRSASTRYRNTLLTLRGAFAGRTLHIDSGTFERAGAVRAARESAGRPLGIQDAMIAAICIFHGATLATRNVRDFDGLDLKLVNPFEASV